MNYVYITSVEHSGSTLITCLLAAHPSITSVGEFAIPFGENATCSCGAVIKECLFWNRWREAAEKRNIAFKAGQFDINILSGQSDNFIQRLFYHQFPSRFITSLKDIFYYGSDLRKDCNKKVNHSVKLAKLLCELNHAEYFVDSSKNAQQIRHLAKSPELNLKVIGLVRDGRAVMNSVIKREGYSTQQAIDSWLYGNKHLIRALDYVPKESRMLVKLEDLCNAPEETQKELFNFLELDTTSPLNFDASSRHIVGNSMRLSFDGTIRAHDDSWKEHLSREQLIEFERQAGDVNRKFGYH